MTGIMVKELEWEGDIAVSMAGSYLVVPYRDRFGLVGPDDSLDGFSHRVTGSREECKAAAQKDFETRILSALLFPCEACDGSGVQVFATRVYEPGCGYAHDSSDERSCDQCAGTGKREAAQADFEARIRSALIPTAQAGECSEATETLTPMSGFLTFIKDMRFTGSWDLPTLNRVIEVGEAIAEQNPSPAQGTVERAEPVAETLPVIVSRAASVICEVGALCGWPGPECKSEEAAQALFDAGLLASVDSDALKALRECLAYIRSPLRMTRDEDEDARRDGIIKRANAALNASVGPK